MNRTIRSVAVFTLVIVSTSGCGMTEVEEVEELPNLTGYYTLVKVVHRGPTSFTTLLTTLSRVAWPSSRCCSVKMPMETPPPVAYST